MQERTAMWPIKAALEAVHDDGPVNEGLLAIVALGLLAGGAIVVIDTLILRRIRRQAPRSDAPDRDDQR